MTKYFYEFFVRGEFENPDKLGQIKGAFVTYAPIAVDDGVAIVGKIGAPEPMVEGDYLPAELADKINVAALATVSAQNAELAQMNDAMSFLQTEIARLQKLVDNASQSR